MAGPLAGTTIVELAGIGPAPFAGMLLADLGARVVRVDRPGAVDPVGHGIINRSRVRLGVDLKDPDGVAVVRRLATVADGLVEGYRPGVLERIGLGPDVLLADNPALVVGRMTGWGQEGPWAQAAGHDIDYVAVTGALDAIGRRGAPPTVPLNLVGDFGGGATYLVIGMLAGILHARATGTGQVVDAAMVDGASSLMAMARDLADTGLRRPERGTNLLDSGAWFYDTYRCADGRWLALGPIEPRFRAELVRLLDLDERFEDGDDPRHWEELSEALAAVVATRPLAEWDDLLAGTDACYAPVLTLDEAPSHPHLAARQTHVEVDGRMQPAPAPRFSATPSAVPTTRSDVRAVDDLLGDAGMDPDEVTGLRDRGILI
ncbi:CaiB/BaiF CoA transferase family protein [Salsipaludibacter albus]|uniref:CaiB/BaiF CoA transferase family protein n=1 Tax=Salsipaludibacter albus TaxID=2849650 RepID=UPI001EE3D281|nr:CaiB/BaiF CoA-transferase family protein [Salsipaludibacter albus]MBY5163427.1 CoA transferase [Salsipaludibacter albus]